jgi:hypothetical protein
MGWGVILMAVAVGLIALGLGVFTAIQQQCCEATRGGNNEPENQGAFHFSQEIS